MWGVFWRNFFAVAVVGEAVSTVYCMQTRRPSPTLNSDGWVGRGADLTRRERSAGSTTSFYFFGAYPQRLNQAYAGDRRHGAKSLQRRSPRPADSRPPRDKSSGGAGSEKAKKAKEKKGAAKNAQGQTSPEAGSPNAPDAATGAAAADRAAAADERKRARQERRRQTHKVHNTPQSKTLAGFQSLRAARLWLLGRTPAHIDRLGAFRALTDLWVEYDAAAKSLRLLRAQAARLPPDADPEAAAALQRDMEQEQATKARLADFVNVRRKYARYMAKLAGAIGSTAVDADIMAAIEQSVARLRDMGYDLPAKAAEIVPPEEMDQALAEAEAAQGAVVAAEGTTMPTLRQQWEMAADTLVREAMEQEGATGTSWLKRHGDAEAKRRYLLSHGSLWDVLQGIKSNNPDALPTLTKAMEARLQSEINREFTQCVTDGYPEDHDESCRERWTFVTAQRKRIRPVYTVEKHLRIKYQVHVNQVFLECLRKLGKSYEQCMRESERVYRNIKYQPRAPDQPPPRPAGKPGRPRSRRIDSGPSTDDTSSTSPPRPSPMALVGRIRSAVSLMRQSAESGLRNVVYGGGAASARLGPPLARRPTGGPWPVMMRHP